MISTLIFYSFAKVCSPLVGHSTSSIIITFHCLLHNLYFRFSTSLWWSKSSLPPLFISWWFEWQLKTKWRQLLLQLVTKSINWKLKWIDWHRHCKRRLPKRFKQHNMDYKCLKRSNKSKLNMLIWIHNSKQFAPNSNRQKLWVFKKQYVLYVIYSRHFLDFKRSTKLSLDQTWITRIVYSRRVHVVKLNDNSVSHRSNSNCALFNSYVHSNVNTLVFIGIGEK